MLPISALWFRLPTLSATLLSSALAFGVGYTLTPSEPLEPLEVPLAVAVSAPMQTLALADITSQSGDDCLFYSAFDVQVVRVEPGQESATLHRRFHFMDGCDWESEEVLTLGADGRYRYTYSEHALMCGDDAVAATACTRSGFAMPASGADDQAFSGELEVADDTVEDVNVSTPTTPVE